MADEKEPRCCSSFSPEEWDGKDFEWSSKRFIKDHVFTLFYMPVNFGSVITRIMAKAEKAGAAVPNGLCLSDHTSKWRMDLYLAVDKDVPGAENVILSGSYVSKVYEGGYDKIGEWMKDFEQYTKDRNLSISRQYMWYTTCPTCAKKHGKNYVVIIGQVEK